MQCPVRLSTVMAPGDNRWKFQATSPVTNSLGPFDITIPHLNVQMPSAEYVNCYLYWWQFRDDGCRHNNGLEGSKTLIRFWAVNFFVNDQGLVCVAEEARSRSKLLLSIFPLSYVPCYGTTISVKFKYSILYFVYLFVCRGESYPGNHNPSDYWLYFFFHFDVKRISYTWNYRSESEKDWVMRGLAERGKERWGERRKWGATLISCCFSVGFPRVR